MTWQCARQWVCARRREFRALVEWLAPTKRQVMWSLAFLFFLFMLMGIGESNRKNRVIRATAAQMAVIEERLKNEIDRAQGVHAEMLARIETLERHELEQTAWIETLESRLHRLETEKVDP